MSGKEHDREEWASEKVEKENKNSIYARVEIGPIKGRKQEREISTKCNSALQILLKI